MKTREMTARTRCAARPISAVDSRGRGFHPASSPSFGGLVQSPAVHIWLPLHTVAQPPQFFGSEVTSTQAPPHAVSPALHVSSQRPALQATVPFMPGAQTAPHWPQFAGSEVTLTQVFPQFVWPEEQTTVHAPATHDMPAAHAAPHIPQFKGSESRRTQASPHTENGAVHVMPHLLPLHTAAPFGGMGQTTPHPPQLPALLVVSTHAASHDVVPAGHRSRH